LDNKLNIISKPSPNFGERKNNTKPHIIVIHYTAMRNAREALRLLRDPKSEVSSHYLIDETGQIFSLVKEHYRAWHAGVGKWRGCEDINSSSIGIELCNSGKSPYSFLLFNALLNLVKIVKDRWSIDKSNVIGHSDLAPNRKKDPGRHFDWRALELHGLATEVQMDETNDDFWSNLDKIGYHVPNSNSYRNDLLEAFRSRYCPENFGYLNSRDIMIACGIAKNLNFSD